MKIRQGFVSNSSSSSFTISKDDITNKQLKQIISHKVVCKRYAMFCSDGEEWEIIDHGKVVTGFTYMDNFNMEHFLRAIGVSDNVIKWH